MTRRNETGLRMQVGRVLPVSDGLVASVLGADYGKPRERRALQAYNGKHPAGVRQAKHPDHVILEVRRLKEQHQVMPLEISRRLTALGYAVTHEDAKRILSYAVRAHLVPDEGAPCYLPAEKQAA